MSGDSNPPPSAAETVPVTYTLIGIESVRNSGRLIALAIVEIDVAGVVLTLQGVRVMRRPDGSLAVEAPTFRHPRTGKSLPCILLPPALAQAFADDVLTAMGAATVALQGTVDREA
jgi:hypothetical protein